MNRTVRFTPDSSLGSSNLRPKPHQMEETLLPHRTFSERYSGSRRSRDAVCSILHTSLWRCCECKRLTDLSLAASPSSIEANGPLLFRAIDRVPWNRFSGSKREVPVRSGKRPSRFTGISCCACAELAEPVYRRRHIVPFRPGDRGASGVIKTVHHSDRCRERLNPCKIHGANGRLANFQM